MAFKLHISGPYGSKTVTVDNELSIGRTDQANLALDDSGLSRVNSIFFVDEGELLVADENSTNGTFINGERLEGRPRVLQNGDRVKIGTYTEIRVESGDAASTSPVDGTSSLQQSTPSTTPVAPTPTPKKSATQKPKAKGQGPNTQTYLVIGSAVMTVLILVFGGIGIYLLVRDPKPNGTGGVKGPMIASSSAIPRRVIDPLGGEDEDDLDDLMASWETAEKEIDANTLSAVSVDAADTSEADLNVSVATFAAAKAKALEARPGEGGIRPAGLAVPKELFGDGVIKQKAKLREMMGGSNPYQQPMDFADLAAKRLSGDLVEMPMASDSYYLDVGGSAQDSPFLSFAFPENRSEIASGHPKFSSLASLAEKFKVNLSDAAARKQIRVRLLRMFQKPAKPILLELAAAYHQRFGRPLRVTSLTRSMDYQILLNAGNANSFKVRGEGSLPPHTSGCAFDLARKHMPVEEQNFVMAKLAEMERAGKLDALIEYGVNACFHVFIYRDGTPPRM